MTKWGQGLTKGERRSATRQRNEAIIAAHKDVPCSDCGAVYPRHVMDLHHVGLKTMSIKELRSAGLPTVCAELLNCEALCANCHRARHPPEKVRQPSKGSPTWGVSAPEKYSPQGILW